MALRLNDALNNSGIKTQTWFLNRKTPDFTVPKPNLVYNRRVNFFGFLLLWGSLFRLLRSYKPDVVLTMLPYANIIGLFTAWLCGVNKRIASHRNVCDKELSFVLKKIDAFSANTGLYTHITAVSKSTKESFQHYSKKAYSKITVIHNGLEYNSPELSKEACRKVFNLESKAYIIGTVGRLVEQKNHLFLLPLLQQIPEVKLVIVGKGNLEKDIMNKAKDLGVSYQIQIIPEVNSEEVPLFLKCLDVYVMPSIFEGLSNALVEAMFAGLPILTSDVPSQRDVVIRDSDGLEAGIVLPLDKPDQWIGTIRNIIEDAVLRESLSGNALKRSQDFTLENMSNGYITLFKSVHT